MRSFLATAVLATAVAVGLPFPIAAVQNRPSLEIAQEFVRAAFPQLVGGGHFVLVSLESTLETPWSTGGILNLIVIRSGTHYEASASRDEQWLSGEVIASSSKDIVIEAHFAGRFVHSREMDHLRRDLESQSTWTEADVTRELTAGGASFPPNMKAKFVQSLQLDALSKLIGPVESQEVAFDMIPSSLPPVEIRGPDPSWVVLLKTQRRPERDRCVWLTFEPFEGRLSSFTRSDCYGFE